MEPDRADSPEPGEALSHQAFDELYDRYKMDIYRYVCYLTQDRAEADDLFQEVWLRVVRSLPAQEIRQNLKPWLLTIVLNLHRDGLRKKRIRRLISLSRTRPDYASLREEPAARGFDPAVTAEQAMLQKNIANAIARLPERQRRIFVLKEVEGLRQADIAGILGIPVGTVKSLMYRAVKRLQRELAAYNPRGEKLKCDAKMLSV